MYCRDETGMGSLEIIRDYISFFVSELGKYSANNTVVAT